MLTRWEEIEADIKEALTEEEYANWQTYLDRVEFAVRNLKHYRIALLNVGRFQVKLDYLHKGLMYGKAREYRKECAQLLKKYYTEVLDGELPKQYVRYFRELRFKKFWKSVKVKGVRNSPKKK